MSASNSHIEPPHIISDQNEGLKVIADVLTALKAMRNETAPLAGLLYLKFNTEAELDEWSARFKTISNHYWREKMNKKDDLCYLCVSRVDDRTTLDVFFAETEENVKAIGKLRFPEWDF